MAIMGVPQWAHGIGLPELASRLADLADDTADLAFLTDDDWKAVLAPFRLKLGKQRRIDFAIRGLREEHLPDGVENSEAAEVADLRRMFKSGGGQVIARTTCSLVRAIATECAILVSQGGGAGREGLQQMSQANAQAAQAQARIQERVQQAQRAEQAQAQQAQAQQAQARAQMMAQQAQRQAADRQKISMEEPEGPLQAAQRQAQQQMAMQERLPRSRAGGEGGGGGGRRDFDREREAARLAAHKRMLERPF